MEDNDNVDKLLTGRSLDARKISKKKGKKLKEETGFGYGYVKY